MLLKPADDKTPDIAALEALLRRNDVDAPLRGRIEQELWAIRLGVKAESEAAYQLDFDLEDSRNWLTIHDLRLEIDGWVAQIDHLLISRILEVFVCESKSFSGGVKVNEHGEWTTFRNRLPVGIPSPVEQNRRHIAVIERAIKRGLIDVPRRIIPLQPAFENVVLLSAHGSIGRPADPPPELDFVVKVDQFRTRLRERDIPTTWMLKTIRVAELEAFGRQLVALHRPARVDWAKRFGLPATPALDASERIGSRTSAQRCASCGNPVSYAEARFCWFNKARFGGKVYCMTCQQVVAPAPGKPSQPR